MSVVGYDGILLSQVLRPKLTTFRQDAETMGRKAAALLIEQIEKPKSWIPQLVTVSGELLEGHSVQSLSI